MSPTKRSRCRSHRATLDAVLDGRERLAALQSLELHAESCMACAGALDPMGGLQVVNTMGTLMQDHLIGGQTIYPFVDEN